MSEVRERLTAYIRIKNINISQFEKAIGVSSGYVNNISKSIQPDKLQAISDHFSDLNIEWLLIGKGGMLKKNAHKAPVSSGRNPIDANGAGNRIKQVLMYAFSGDIASMARKTFISVQRIQELMTSHEFPTFGEISDLAQHTNIDIDWLITGRGEMLQSSEPVSGTATGRPYYDVDFRCGFDEMVNDQTSVPACLISYPPYDKDGVLWCNATGNSMSPEINPGDIIALLEVHDWQSFLAFGETYAIAAANGLRTIKKVRKGSSPDTLLLVPVNRAEHDEQEIEKAQITHVFRVLAAIKKF